MNACWTRPQRSRNTETDSEIETGDGKTVYVETQKSIFENRSVEKKKTDTDVLPTDLYGGDRSADLPSAEQGPTALTGLDFYRWKT